MPLHLLVKEGLLSRDLLLSPNLLLSLNIHYYQRFHCPFLAYSYSSLVRQSGYYSITQGKLVNPIKSCFLRLRRRSGTCIDCPSKNVFPRLKFNKGLPFEAAWVFHLGLFFFSIRCAFARRMAGLPIWMKVGQGKKWTFFSIGCCHGVGFCFRITFCSSVRRCFGNRCSFIGWCSSRVWKRGIFFRRRSNFFSFAEDETYKRHPGTGSQPPEEKGGGNWVGVPFFGGFAARSYTRRVNLAGRRVMIIVKTRRLRPLSLGIILSFNGKEKSFYTVSFYLNSQLRMSLVFYWKSKMPLILKECKGYPRGRSSTGRFDLR